MTRFDPDDDTPAPFVRIKQRRKLTGTVKQAEAASVASSCIGKRAFSSAAEAFSTLSHKPDINGRRAYRCRFCHQYHIGTRKE